MQNDIFLPDSQFFEGKVSFHLAQRREKERERERGKEESVYLTGSRIGGCLV